MRRRQQAIAEQRREHEAFLRERQRQQEEAFRRNKARQNALRHLREKQQQGYQVVQDWDGQLYLVPPYQSSVNSLYNDSDLYELGTDNECSKVTMQDTRKTIPINASNVTAASNNVSMIGNARTETKTSNVAREVASVTEQRKKATVVVEDVSDSEEDFDDISATLNKTLRNRRPSPGQWLEPVEMMT